MLSHCLSLLVDFLRESRAGTSLLPGPCSGERRGTRRCGPGVGPCGSVCWTSSGIMDPLVDGVQEPLIALRIFWRCSGGTSVAEPPPRTRGESPQSPSMVAITGMMPGPLVASAMKDGGTYCKDIAVPNGRVVVGGRRGCYGLAVSGRGDGGRKGYLFLKNR